MSLHRFFVMLYDISDYYTKPAGAAFTCIFNVLFLIILCRPRIQSPTNRFLTRLAITDIIASVAYIWCTIHWTICHYMEKTGFCGDIAIDIFKEAGLPTVLHGVSLYLTAAMTLHRYIIVCHPFKVHICG